MAINTSTIPQLTTAPTIHGEQVLEISDGTTSYKVTFSQLVAWLEESGGLVPEATPQVYQSTTAPVDPPDDPTKAALTYTNSGSVHAWDIVNQVWGQLI